MWHTEPRAATRIENLMATIVVRRQHADWRTQLFEPAGNIFLLLLPRRFARAGAATGEHIADLAALLNELDEIIAPEVLRRGFTPRAATKSKILQAALEQMLVAQSRDRPVIQADKWHRTVV